MTHGKIETRRWHTTYRGWVLICASKTPYSVDTVFNISGQAGMDRITGVVSSAHCFKDMLLGKAIAIGRLVDCRLMQPEDEEKAFVEYYPDLYSHIYEDVQPIIPYEWKGTQGWKEVSMEVKEKINFLWIPEEYRKLTDSEIIYGDQTTTPIRYHKIPDAEDTNKT